MKNKNKIINVRARYWVCKVWSQIKVKDQTTFYYDTCPDKPENAS